MQGKKPQLLWKARKSGNMKLMCAAVELQMRLALANCWLKSCVPMLQPE